MKIKNIFLQTQYCIIFSDNIVIIRFISPAPVCRQYKTRMCIICYRLQGMRDKVRLKKKNHTIRSLISYN